jgi:hypothetical protein
MTRGTPEEIGDLPPERLSRTIKRLALLRETTGSGV